MTDQAYADALAPGYRMHWYTVERVLGQGGFGITYLARDNNLDQLIALKEYLPVEVAARRQDATVRSRGEGLGERFRWGLERFIQEARTLARFDHPNIVRVHSVFEFNGTAYMVMRFEEGENFGTLLERRGTLPERDLLRVLLPVLDGLELVHNAGFIHRDVKPDNIHIRADGTPVLLDFGSARHSLGKSRTLTILVAPGYAPFEQYYSNSESQGPWTDIYGLAATCYRAISGAPPLDAITRSKGILGSTREVLAPARSVGAGRYSGRLLAAVDRALEFAEKDRPQTIAEWRKELVDEPDLIIAPATPVAQTAAVPTLGRSAAEGPVIWAVLGSLVAATAVVLWLQPRDEPRIAELERRVEVQRQKDEQARNDEERRRQEEAQRRADEQAKREAQAKLDAERQRQEEEAARKRQELAKKPEAPPRLVAAQPALPKKKPDVPAAQPSGKPAPALASPSRPAPSVATISPAPEPVMEPAPKSAVQPVAPDASLLPAPDAPAQPVPAPKKAPEQPVAVPKDDAGAFARYRKLAMQGDAEAAFRLAEFYESGRGVTQSNNWAYTWYVIAERRGASAAKSRKDEVAKKLQPREVLQGDRAAANLAGQAK